MSSPTALLILADGAEEMEAVIAADVMRRANIAVTIAGLSGDGVVTCSRKVNVKPDLGLEDVKNNLYDVLVLPGGGKGAKNICESTDMSTVMKNHYDNKKLIAAICAAPTALAAHGIAKGAQVTSYPAMREKMSEYKYVDTEDVVRDGNILTSRGPGTAFAFALEIVSILCGNDVAEKLRGDMLLK